MVTRRTTRRHFLLRPDEDGTIQNIYWYTTAVVARKFGIKLHAVQVLSTHMHEVLTDVHGNLPAFLRERNRAFANAIKCHRRWPEEVFQRAAVNCVHIHGPVALLRQIAYTLSNCVEAGLADSPATWPGVSTTENDLGTRTVRATRPEMYFDPRNPNWPDEIEISIEMPDVLAATYGPLAAAKRVGKIVREVIGKAREAARAAGKVAAKLEEIVNASISRRSRSFERMRGREPTLATAGDGQVTKEAVAQKRIFLEAYKWARSLLKAGREAALFPPGTWRWVSELLPPQAARSSPSSRPDITARCSTRSSTTRSSTSVSPSSVSPSSPVSPSSVELSMMSVSPSSS